jgi:hypothetical protein
MMFKSFLALIFLISSAFALAAGQIPKTHQLQRQTVLLPEARTEPVRAIKAPRTPLPSEKDSAGVNHFS